MPDQRNKPDPDSFWDLEALMPPKRKQHGAFAKDTETVAVTVAEANEGADGSVPIPPPDPERMARAREALRRAEERIADANERIRRAEEILRRSMGETEIPGAANSRKPVPHAAHEAGSEFPDAREMEYLRAQRRREEMESRYRGGGSARSTIPTPAEQRTRTRAYEPVLIYAEDRPDNPILSSIRVYQNGHGETLDPIREQAMLYHSMTAREETREPVPFFSVIPRYGEMDEGQRAWYLSFREQVRGGSYPPADSAYVALYAYELLNLTPDPVSPQEALNGIIALWRHYREKEKRLDYLVPEWIVDLCLIYRLPAPDLDSALSEIAIRVSSLKEFFLGCAKYEIGSPFANAVLRYGCNYRYQASRFRTEENAPLFDTHIPAAFLTAFTHLEQVEDSPVNFGLCPRRAFVATMVRNSFAGSSFARHLKRRVDVSYLSCTRSVELRFMATDLMKYCENQVRKMVGIKSRFHTASMDARLKGAADAYFEPLLPKPADKKRRAARTEQEPIPEWDALYEAQSQGFDPARARALEQSAWNITKQLVETFEEPDGTEESESAEEARAPAPSPASPADPAPIASAEPGAPASPPRILGEEGADQGVGADPVIREAFALLLRGDRDGLDAHARNHRLLPLTLVERMNEMALDELGDIAVEEEGGGFTLIEDYREEIKRWMNL